MRAIGFSVRDAIRTRFPQFVSTEDAYGFLRQESLASDGDPVTEPCVVFDLATVPMPWFERNAGVKKACILRNRRDVEMFLSVSARFGSTYFEPGDMILVWDKVALNGNERAALRAAGAEFFDDLEQVLSVGGMLDRWPEQPRIVFSAEATLVTDFHVLRYRSREPVLIFKRLVTGDFLFENDIGISATTIVMDVPTSLHEAEEGADFDEVFVFLESGVSTYETISLYRHATGRNPMITDQVAYSVEGISKTLIQLRLA